MPYKVISIFPDRRETRNFHDFDLAVTIFARACKQASRAEIWHIDFQDNALMLGTFDEEGSSWRSAKLAKTRPARFLSVSVKPAARIRQAVLRLSGIFRYVAPFFGL